MISEISTGRVWISSITFIHEQNPHLMKAHTSLRTFRQGFTLVELLVVIAIIAILATMAVTGARIAQNAASNAAAKAAIGDLTNALDSFYDDQDSLPLGRSYEEDTEVRTDNELTNVLTGIDTDENPSGITYLTFKKAKGSNNNYWDGMHRTSSTSALYGPWKNRNQNERYYRVMMNYDYNEFVQEPNNVGSEEVYGYKYLIYHAGKDGELGGEENLDNIYSWK